MEYAINVGTLLASFECHALWEQKQKYKISLRKIHAKTQAVINFYKTSVLSVAKMNTNQFKSSQTSLFHVILEFNQFLSCRAQN